MGKTLKKALSIVCAITLVATGMTGFSLTNVVADTTTTVIKTDEADTRAALLEEIANADYNFALGKSASVSQLTTYNGGTDLSIVTNGLFSTGNSTNTIIEAGQGNTTDFAWVQVDLGTAYDTSKINRVAVQYKTANSGPKSGYTISYSLNGVEFVTVATVDAIAGSANQIYLDTLALTQEQAEAIPYARYVRITSTKISDTSAYGLQVKGMAVLTDGTVKVSEVGTKEVEKLDAPKSVTVTSSDYCQLEYIFEGSEGHDDYTYYSYVNGSMGNEPVVPGTKYVVNGLAAGTHEIKVVSYKDGSVSDPIAGVVDVKDYKTLISDERNIASGKTATSNSVRAEDAEVQADKLLNLTDGVISGDVNTRTYRTEQNNANASITIDLGKEYKAGALERIVMVFNTGRYAQDYTVECSLDGETYEQIGAVTGANSELTTAELSATGIEATETRYVKINFTKAVAIAYGYQIYEIAIIENYIDISEAEITMPETVKYTGEAIVPEISLTYKDKELVVDKDYELEITDNTVVGTANVKINGLGRYTGTLDKTFTITKQNVENVTINTEFDTNNELNVSVLNGNLPMVVDTDYTCVVDTDEDGNITVTITGIGDNYEGEVTKTILLADMPVNEAVNVEATSPELNKIQVQFDSPDKLGAESQLYDIYIDDELVEEGVVAGTYVYEQQFVGAHTVKVVAILGDKESIGISKDVEVAGVDLGGEDIEIRQIEIAYIYSGKPITTEFDVMYGEVKLVPGVDYTVEYMDNINAGIAKFIVKGIGLYQGQAEGSFQISKQTLVSDFVKVRFNSERKLVIEVVDTFAELTLVEGVDYNYTEVTDGDYNVTVTITALEENYTGEVTATISGDNNPNKPEPTTVAPTTQEPKPTTVAPTTSIVKRPNRVKVTKVKKLGKNKAKVSWKKLKGAKGYQIRYSTSQKFKKAKTKLVKKNVAYYTIKKLTKKKYYIQVRAYVMKNKKRYYGKWSKSKTVRLKK